MNVQRVTQKDVEAMIRSEHYFTAAQGDAKAIEDEAFAAAGGAMNVAAHRSPPPELRMITVCVLLLVNGFTIVGHSTCASPEWFDDEIGRQEARKEAIRALFPYVVHQQRQSLYRAAMEAVAVKR